MSDYAQLQTDVQAWLARDDLDVQAFIRLAEQELNRELRVQGMVVSTSSTPVDAGGGKFTVDYPADLLELRDIRNGGDLLSYVTPQQFTTELDTIYTLLGEQILLTQAGDIDYHYYAQVPALSDSNLTNLWTDRLYDALFYLSLYHGTVYMEEERPGYFEQGMRMARRFESMDNQAKTAGSTRVVRGLV